MPWLVRNYEAFGKPVFIRDNFGMEFRIGNNPLSEGPYVLAYHPSRECVSAAQDTSRWARRRLSPTRDGGHREWIAQNPGRCAVLTLRRVVYFWNGLPRLSKIQGLSETKNSLFLASSDRGDLGTSAGDQAASSRRVSLCQPDGLLSGGLLYNLSAASLSPSHRSRAADSGGLSGF